MDKKLIGIVIFGLAILSVGLLASAPNASAADEAKLDFVFVIDTTGSMSDAIDDTKADANDIVDEIMTNVPDSRIAVVGYRDFGDLYVTKEYEFSSSKSEVKDNIDDLVTGGGGDVPEAVYEALKYTIVDDIAGSWRSSATKVIMLMGDARPHEEDDGGDYLYTAPDVIKIAKSNDVIICTIAVDVNFGTEDYPNYNDPRPKFEELAKGTGCEAFEVEDVADVSSKVKDVVDIAVDKADDDVSDDDDEDFKCCFLDMITGSATRISGFFSRIF